MTALHVRMTDETHKTCPMCRQSIPVKEYRFYKGKPFAYCRPCSKLRSAQYRERSNEKVTPEKIVWNGMRQRCNNPNNLAYPNYGGRGITVCERWLDFTNFYADMGDRPKGTSLDRIDNDKGYYKENCRWADKYEQAWNKRGSKGSNFHMKGVHFSKRNQYWVAAATYKGKRNCLYYGPSQELAIKARREFDESVEGGLVQ